MNGGIGVRLALAIALLLTTASQAGAQTASAAACPPQAQEPTPQQLQAAAAQARDRGLLWRITRDGRTSYLYGSIHVGKLDWAFPGPQVRAALQASDTVALEIDVGDPQMAERMKPPASFAAPVLTPALRERLARLADAACVPRELLATLHPVMQAITLMVLAARWQGLDPSFAQEFALSGFARAGQRRVVSLESPELQMAVLIPRDAADAERMVVQMVEQLEQGSVPRVIARLASAWERGDLADVGDYERWCDCVASDDDRLQMQRLNDDRNPALADGIEALHRDGRKVFAAVGALHMTGAKALPDLLARRGFSVQRVALQ
ncbi:MAG: TraB/GumN family protein [Pseudomonadota bacterium]